MDRPTLFQNEANTARDASQYEANSNRLIGTSDSMEARNHPKSNPMSETPEGLASRLRPPGVYDRSESRLMNRVFCEQTVAQ
jgi:hypothetical protein